MSFIFDEIQRWISTASAGELFFGTLLFFVCVEQILYLFPATYIYRIGFAIRRVPISDEHISILTDKKTQPSNLVSKMNRNKTEIYLRNRYPLGCWGPLLFVGQIQIGTSNMLNIRIGIFVAILFVSSLVIAVFRGVPSPFDIFDFIYRLINLAILIVLVAIFYFRLIRSLKI